MKRELTFWEFLCVIFRQKRVFACFLTLTLGMAVGYLLFTPNIYKAESLVRPASRGEDKASLMMAQLGGLASLAGFSGGGTTGELMIGILRSNAIIDSVIDRFDLMAVYDQDIRLKMRDKVRKDILHATEDIKSGIVTVAVLDEDPERAASMANFFVENLQKKLQTLVVGEAAQRRTFFEDQLQQAFKNLGDAEDAMVQYQENSGMIAMEPQIEAILTSIASLRAQIMTKEVELSALRTYAKKDNPSLKMAQSQLKGMREELAKLEEQQKQQKITENEGGVFPSIKQAPYLGVEYQRHLRNVKMATALYELMLKQLEAAKLDEAREALIVQVLDPATPPDYKFKPKRLAILVFSALLGFCLSILWALGSHYIASAREDMKKRGSVGEP